MQSAPSAHGLGQTTFLNSRFLLILVVVIFVVIFKTSVRSLTFLVLLLVALTPTTFAASSASGDSIEQLMLEGNLARLNGDMAKANAIQQKIRTIAPGDPASYAFNLNTIITELSWEESQTRFDQALINEAEKLIELCESKTPSQSGINNPDYFCGEAHFALSYYNGIRGNLIRAGRHGTTAIDYMERALKREPELAKAKMYLGVAFYYADNLPAFVKLFSRVLWFIPSGNSDKSLPYLRQVMASDDAFSDVARYLYATLLINGSQAEIKDALSELEILLSKYPRNIRFHLRYISVLLGEDQHQAALDSIDRVFALDSASSIDVINRNLLNIWAARSHLGLGQFDEARSIQSRIQLSSAPTETTVPGWGLAWHALTMGQLADVAGHRSTAISHYQSLIEIEKRTFINPQLVELARGYMRTAYVWQPVSSVPGPE